MSLHKFLNLIEHTPGIGPFVANREKLVEDTDPDRIYVENIRAFFGIPFRFAEFLCDLAVRQGVFARKIGLICPQCGKMLLSVDSEDDVPEQILCDVCEIDERDQYIFDSAELTRLPFYQLIR